MPVHNVRMTDGKLCLTLSWWQVCAPFFFFGTFRQTCSWPKFIQISGWLKTRSCSGQDWASTNTDWRQDQNKTCINWHQDTFKTNTKIEARTKPRSVPATTTPRPIPPETKDNLLITVPLSQQWDQEKKEDVFSCDKWCSFRHTIKCKIMCADVYLGDCTVYFGYTVMSECPLRDVTLL